MASADEIATIFLRAESVLGAQAKRAREVIDLHEAVSHGRGIAEMVAGLEARLMALRNEIAADERGIAERLEAARLHASDVMGQAEEHLTAAKKTAAQHIEDGKAEAERIIREWRDKGAREADAVAEHLDRWARSASQAEADHAAALAAITKVKAEHADVLTAIEDRKAELAAIEGELAAARKRLGL